MPTTKNQTTIIDTILSNIESPKKPFANAEQEKQRLLIQEVLQNGVFLDEYGLIIPELQNKTICDKIALDIVKAKKSIDNERRKGKTIIYIPGSYDLVHAGHASYALQVVKHYLGKHTKKRRSDLFVVTLTDDDDLIRTVKAKKWKGLGGKEPFRRPVQAIEEFKNICDTHPRLLDLTSIPYLDLVAFIPSPRNARTFFDTISSAPHSHLIEQKNNNLNKTLQNFIVKKNPPETDSADLQNALVSYEKLIEHITRKQYDAIIEAFSAWALPNTAINPTSPWTVQSWQLLIHMFLGASIKRSLPSFVRIVSEDDSAYKYQVEYLMQQCGIEVEYIADEKVISTTDLLTKHGADILLNSKKMHYEKNI
ncbi:MAG: hypothetical protein HYW78_00110 [Parcubacteria group bacterium]|nr:hypothetical protein [Parcubacteria group bacterium]